MHSHAERGNDRVGFRSAIDEEVVALFNGIYQGGLEALRANYPA